MKVFDELAPEVEHQFKIDFRSSLTGKITAKFLIRYEVESKDADQALSNICRYRYVRLQTNLYSKELFNFAPQVHMSAKKANDYIINL